MKIIHSWNEEFLELRVVMAVPEEEDAMETFHKYVKERVMWLLDVSAREAEKSLADETDEVHYNGENGVASIVYGDYTEFLRLEDVPETPGKD